MTRKYYLFVWITLSSLFLVGCSQNDVINLEDSNAYTWQKYMNVQEYEALKPGMTYEEVMQIAKGAGKDMGDSVYRWPDEQLMTQVYDVKFENNELVSKDVVEVRGNSIRDLPEKAPAVPNDEGGS